jgi:predicted flap endonuclease-1-like 5' DNA nuclease
MVLRRHLSIRRIRHDDHCLDRILAPEASMKTGLATPEIVEGIQPETPPPAGTWTQVPACAYRTSSLRPTLASPFTKLTMAQRRKKPAKAVRQVARLEDIPNVGPAVAADLRRLGITSPAELLGRDP